jgi:hypothetical protein
MHAKKPSFRVKIKRGGTPPQETYEWEIYRNSDVLPVLRSERFFRSRVAGLADANRARLHLADVV